MISQDGDIGVMKKPWLDKINTITNDGMFKGVIGGIMLGLCGGYSVVRAGDDLQNAEIEDSSDHDDQRSDQKERSKTRSQNPNAIVYNPEKRQNSVIKDALKKGGKQRPEPIPSSIEVTETDVPESVVVTDSNADSIALAKLKTADDHRNQRLQFTQEESVREAYRLYGEILGDTTISPDLRARAKINMVRLYPLIHTSNAAFANPQHVKEETLRATNEIIHEASYSPDVRGWAKRHLAKLYLSGSLDITADQAKEKALSLLEENIKDPLISSETKSRTRLQLAKKLLERAFNVSDDEAEARATTLMMDVMNDEKARPDLRLKAKLIWATSRRSEEDPGNAKRLKIFKEAITNAEISPLMRAEIKDQLATDYFMQIFDLSPADACERARILLDTIASDTTLPVKKRIIYYIKRADHYLNLSFDMKPSEARAIALRLYNDIEVALTLDTDQSYDYKVGLANLHIQNRFHLKPSEARTEAARIYNTLLSDQSLPIHQKIDIRWIVANLYATRTLKPPSGVNGQVAAIELINQVINSVETPMHIRNTFKMNLVLLYQQNGLGVTPGKAREEQIRLLLELLNDPAVTDKTLVQKHLQRLSYNQ